MKIPYEWLTEYVDLTGISPKDVGEAFTALGLMLDKPYDGKVYDLEHRFDRSDWLSILGCARDLAAYLQLDLKLPTVHKSAGKTPTSDQIVKIEVECPKVINRFNTRVFRNVKVKPSPEWMQTRLEEYGIPAINNIVDITNYVMLELGQPMHAQDLSKFRKQEIIIRKARNEEKLVSFLGEELSLYSDAFVLTQDGIPTVLGGIVGGRETGIDEKTCDIILDAGNYNHTVIRQVSRRLKIQNETVLRYDKLLHPNLTEYAIARATHLILELAGGDCYENIDWNPNPQNAKNMQLRFSRILKLAGFNIPKDITTEILTRLGYIILSFEEDSYQLEIPYFRTDIEVEDDIVSDILRINGYSNIPATQIQSAPPKNITPEIYVFEDKLRDEMRALGGHEHITDPLISRSENSAVDIVLLENSQNSSKNALRTKITQTLKEIVPNYTKNQINSGALFELGKIYTLYGREEEYNSYNETRCLECLLFDQMRAPKEIHVETSKLLATLLKNLGILNTRFELSQSATEADIIFTNDADKSINIGNIRYNGFTLLTEALMGIQKAVTRVLTEIQTPNTLETSLVVPKTLAIGTIVTAIKESSEKILNVEFIEEYAAERIGEENKSILLKTSFISVSKTDDCKKLIDTALASLQVKIRD